MNDGVVLIIDVDQHMLDRRVEHRYLDEVAPDYATRCPTSYRGEGESHPPVGRAARQRCPTCFHASWQTGSTRTSSPTRRLRTIHSPTCRTTSRPKPQPNYEPKILRSSLGARGSQWRPTVRRWSASWTPAPKCSTTATAFAPRRSLEGSIGRSTTPGSSRPTSGRCSVRAWDHFVGSRFLAIQLTSPPPIELCSREFPENESLARWIRLAGERVGVPGTSRPYLLARVRRTPPSRSPLQRDGEIRGTQSPDRHPARDPPRLRLRRLPVP